MKAVWIMVLLALTVSAWGTPRSQVTKGNRAAGQGKTDEAVLHYKQALEQKADTSVVLYDLGNVMNQSGQHESAEKSYLGSLHPKTPLPEQAATFYNLGNTYFAEQKYDEAATAYIESLKRNPEDDDAKYNLEVARRMLQQQKQQQQQPDQQQQEQKQDQKEQDKQEDKPQDQQQQQQQPPDQQQNEPQAAKKMSPEEAERILNALLQNEQDALKQAKKVKVQTRAKKEKDW